MREKETEREYLNYSRLVWSVLKTIVRSII